MAWNKFSFALCVTGIFYLGACYLANAQSSNTRYFIAFKDKSGSLYTTTNPAQFLSARAIARRAKCGYPVTTEDIPVNQSYIDSVRKTGAEVIARLRWFNGITVRITNPA